MRTVAALRSPCSALAGVDAGRAERFRSTAPGRRSPTRSTRSGSREYNKLHPNVQINYQSIGSGGGIRQITSADGVLRRHRRADDARAAAGARRARSCTSPPCSAPSCRSTTFPGVTQELKFTGHVLADIFLGKITKWNDPAIAKLNRRRHAAGHRHRRRAPLRRLGHDLHLGRLPGEGLARVEEEGRRRRRPSSGRSASAARATRASPAW